MENMIFKLIIIMICFLYNCDMYGQSFGIKDFILVNDDRSAVKNVVLDVNQDTCSLVKIYTDIPDLIFEGNVVLFRKSNQAYWIYLVGGTKKFTIYQRFLTPTDVVTGDFGIKYLESAKTYVLSLSVPQQLQTVLLMDKDKRKLTKQRREMLKLGRRYDEAWSLYLPFTKRGYIKDDEDSKLKVKAASDMGLPDATYAYYTNILGKSSWDQEVEQIVNEQQKEYNKYLEWLYTTEIGPLNDSLFRDKKYRILSIPLKECSDETKALIIRIVNNCKSLIPYEVSFHHDIKWIHLSDQQVYMVLPKINEYGNSDDYWFIKLKQFFRDLVNISKSIQGSSCYISN